MRSWFGRFRWLGFVVSLVVGLGGGVRVWGIEVVEPVQWLFWHWEEGDTLELQWKAVLDPGWHIYGDRVEGEDGPPPTRVVFQEVEGLELLDSPVYLPARSRTYFDSFFNMPLTYWSDSVLIRARFLIRDWDYGLRGVVEYMACDTERCLPPSEYSFEVVGSSEVLRASGVRDGGGELKSFWSVFWAGFLGGILALLTPCVFPMIPLTVSFFTKGSGGRRGVLLAFLYGLSIIVIYTGLGLVVTILLGPDAMNEMASNGLVNFVFFVIFVLFALSFFGVFELRLPARWATALDNMSTRLGVLGVFFMALTLTVVSFSCTGPIIGTLLVQAALLGDVWGPFSGMLGFSVALAMPFTVFALFPRALDVAPRSGAWMNVIRGSLGFLELALALKFLSNVDLAYRWGFLNRELFLVLWIVIFGLWGLFLLGIFTLDSLPVPREASVFRLLLAIPVFAFVAYLVPGLWGAPLKLISGFPPPLFYREWHMEQMVAQWLERRLVESGMLVAGGGGVDRVEVGVPEPEVETCPLSIPCFHDLGLAVRYARAVGKPILIDFTGWTCVNCRKMEERVWSDPRVREWLAEKYVLVSLYVDEKTPLPADRQFVSSVTGERVETVGDLWSHLQITLFNANSQPYYVPIAPDTTVLTDPVGYLPDPDAFLAFLQRGYEAMERWLAARRGNGLEEESGDRALAGGWSWSSDDSVGLTW